MPQIKLKPQDPEISFLPPVDILPDIKQKINPLELYNNAGIQTKNVNGLSIPVDLDSLKKAVQAKFNFGDQNLANLYKSPLYNQESFLSGVGQGKNYGSNVIDKVQSFLPKVTHQEQLVTNVSPPIEQPLTQNVNKKGFNIGSFLNNPYTRGAIMAATVGLTGGNGLQAAAYGLSTGTNFAQNQQNDKFNRELLLQSGVDPNNLPNGFITDDMLQNYTTLENAKTNRIYRDSIINYYKDRYNQPKDENKKIQELADIYYSAGTLDPENYHNIMEYAKRYPERKLSNKEFEDILSKIPNSLEKQKVLTEKAKEKKYLHDSTKPYSNNKTNNSLEDNSDYKDALAQFSDILNSKHKGKIDYARKQFIKHFGIDPYKKLTGGINYGG